MLKGRVASRADAAYGSNMRDTWGYAAWTCLERHLHSANGGAFARVEAARDTHLANCSSAWEAAGDPRFSTKKIFRGGKFQFNERSSLSSVSVSLSSPSPRPIDSEKTHGGSLGVFGPAGQPNSGCCASVWRRERCGALMRGWGLNERASWLRGFFVQA